MLRPAAPLALADVQTAAGALTVSAFTTDDARLPNAGLALGGSGANRTLTITAPSGQTGAVEVALVVSDGRLNAVTDLPVTILPPASDADADGLPLWWEQAHGLDPTVATGLHGARGHVGADALPNLLEFYCARNPAVGSSSGLPAASLSGDVPPYVHFTCVRRTDAQWLAANVEVSGDLVAWNSGPGFVQPVSALPTGHGVKARATARLLPAPTTSRANRFARLAVGPAP
jgi:hypothetical protein